MLNVTQKKCCNFIIAFTFTSKIHLIMFKELFCVCVIKCYGFQFKVSKFQHCQVKVPFFSFHNHLTHNFMNLTLFNMIFNTLFNYPSSFPEKQIIDFKNLPMIRLIKPRTELCIRNPGRMWLLQQLAWNLPKVLDHSLQGLSFRRICDSIQVDCSLQLKKKWLKTCD